MAERTLHFDCFELLADQRKLLKSGSPVRLGSRAFDILLVLTAQAGNIVSKDELITRVWPELFVEETNLRVHISALRKALGDTGDVPRFIANIPGRGYSFISPLGRKRTSVTATQQPWRRLRPPVQRLFGREGVVDEIAASLEERRLLTIVGPGGIGKTSVALAVAQAVTERHVHGVAFIDLGAVNDPAFIPSALATGMDLTSRPCNRLDDS